MGCPVIGTRSGSIPGVVGDAALLVDPMNPAAIAEAILTYDDVNKRGEASTRGRERAKEFSADLFRERVSSRTSHFFLTKQ